MKYLIITLLLGSCAHSKYPIYRDNAPKKELTHIDKMYDCVIRLIEKNGVKALDAQKVCQKTLRRE